LSIFVFVRRIAGIRMLSGYTGGASDFPFDRLYGVDLARIDSQFCAELPGKVKLVLSNIRHSDIQSHGNRLLDGNMAKPAAPSTTTQSPGRAFVSFKSALSDLRVFAQPSAFSRPGRLAKRKPVLCHTQAPVHETCSGHLSENGIESR